MQLQNSIQATLVTKKCDMYKGKKSQKQLGEESLWSVAWSGLQGPGKTHFQNLQGTYFLLRRRRAKNFEYNQTSV